MDHRTDGKVMLSRRSAFGLAATSVAALGLAACGGSEDEDSAVPGDAVAIARDAYIFGFPLVLMDLTRATAEETVPVNRFRHTNSFDAQEQREVVRPDLDTMDSFAWLDLTREPMVLQVPAMDQPRYWLAQLLDAWSNTGHNPSNMRPQAKSAGPPYTYVVTGPGWSGSLPEDLTPLPMPTPTVWLINRIQVDGPRDLPRVRAIQQQLKLAPLSAWTAGVDVPAPAVPPPRPTVPPAAQLADMAPRAFFDRMCALMKVNSPAPEDAPAMRRFASIGIEPGGAVKGIPDAELATAVATARQQIPVYVGETTIVENGWIYDPGTGRYGTDYLVRAAIAWNGLGAALPEDAIYPTVYGTAYAGGGPSRFRLHFAPGQLPPVDAFWSLTAYTADLYLVPTPAEIYAVGHHVPVVLNPDGSLDLTLQWADPGASVPTGNWLPIPESGQFSMTLRLFAPKIEAIKGIWRPPPLTPLR
ncbi:DUF1254 domain-containing protein [Nocardia amamiensis]|uniref:DUF1254 domain-containing protein n=1 Tax=Nocardia amamiensis TaxID=404578 RepID=A0ABS0CSG3_9NOCA|nr:DUF1254 domain-containing protein [Nocardia amamiensis]MBF6299554.1 DUF1254 domain-containing protein [Nocardia amamiensis]